MPSERLTASGQILGITIGSVLLPPLAEAANFVTSVIKPVRMLADEFPGVTKAVMMGGIALVGLKVSALAGGYAATVFSDGWQIAKGIFNALRPSVIATAVAQKYHAAVSMACAAKTKVVTAAQWLWNAALTANPIGPLSSWGSPRWGPVLSGPTTNLMDSVRLWTKHGKV